MSAVVISEKRCPACGETKPLSQWGKNRSARNGLQGYCKSCVRKRVTAFNAQRRAEMGEDAWRAYRKQLVVKHREKTGNARGKAWNRARSRAVSRLIENHRAEFDALLHREKYEAGLA